MSGGRGREPSGLSRGYPVPDPVPASTDSWEAERPRSPDVREFPEAGGWETSFWSQTGWEAGKGEGAGRPWGGVVSGERQGGLRARVPAET